MRTVYPARTVQNANVIERRWSRWSIGTIGVRLHPRFGPDAPQNPHHAVAQGVRVQGPPGRRGKSTKLGVSDTPSFWGFPQRPRGLEPARKRRSAPHFYGFKARRGRRNPPKTHVALSHVSFCCAPGRPRGLEPPKHGPGKCARELDTVRFGFAANPVWPKRGSQAVSLFLADPGVPNFSRAGFSRAEFTLPHLKLGTPFRSPEKIGHAPECKIESD